MSDADRNQALQPFLVDKAAIKPATETNSNVEQVRTVGAASATEEKTCDPLDLVRCAPYSTSISPP